MLRYGYFYVKQLGDGIYFKMSSIWVSSLSSFSCSSQIEMHKEGDILLRSDLRDPASGHIFQMFRKIGQLIMLSKSSALEENADECLVLRGLLQACRVFPLQFLLTFIDGWFHF